MANERMWKIAEVRKHTRGGKLIAKRRQEQCLKKSREIEGA